MQYKTFVISLPNSIRRANTEKYVKSIIQDFTFYDAIDGKFLTEFEQKELVDETRFIQRYARLPSKPEIGCALSHLNLYRQLALDKDVSYYLILEDDASLHSEIVEAIDVAITNNIEIVSFFSFGAFVKSKNLIKISGNIVLKKVRFHCCSTVAYLISKNVAISILKESNGKVTDLADWPIRNFDKYGFYLSTPNLVEHNDLNSSIEESRQALASRTHFRYMMKFITQAVLLRDIKLLKNYIYYLLFPALLRRFSVKSIEYVSHSIK